MKLNATSEMIPITWPELADMHPFAPLEQAQGYQEMFRDLAQQLATITGFDSVSLQPNSGEGGVHVCVGGGRGEGGAQQQATRLVHALCAHLPSASSGRRERRVCRPHGHPLVPQVARRLAAQRLHHPCLCSRHQPRLGSHGARVCVRVCLCVCVGTRVRACMCVWERVASAACVLHAPTLPCSPP